MSYQVYIDIEKRGKVPCGTYVHFLLFYNVFNIKVGSKHEVMADCSKKNWTNLQIYIYLSSWKIELVRREHNGETEQLVCLFIRSFIHSFSHVLFVPLLHDCSIHKVQALICVLLLLLYWDLGAWEYIRIFFTWFQK